MYIFYLVLIFLSLIGMVFVLASKIFELKTGKRGVLSRLSVSSDPALRRHIEKAEAFFSEFNGTNVAKVFTFVSQKLFHAFGTAGLFVSKHHKKIKNRLNGKQNLSGGGVVSFFLKNVAESKEEDKKL